MKILHFIYDHPENPWVGGGGARRVARMARELHTRGHSITLVSGAYPGARLVREERFEWRFVGSSHGYAYSVASFMIGAWGLLLRERHRFDLVVEDFSVWNPLFCNLWFRGPSVVQLQNYLGREIRRRYGLAATPVEWLERVYPRWFLHRVALSRELASRFGVPAFVNPMGVEASWLSRSVDVGDYVAFLGRIEFHQKGLDRLLRVASKIRAPIKIAGRGPDERRLRESCDGLTNVEYVGPLEGEQKIQFLEQSRLVVMPSRFEGQPLVSLESAALGRPMVVSQIPELAFVVRNGFGLSVDVDNPDGFARAVNTVFDDPKGWADMNVAARRFAQAQTWDRISEAFEKYCLQLGGQAVEHG